MRQTVTTRKIWKTSNKVHVSGNCDDICYTRTESKVHIHTCHEVITRENRNINVIEKNGAEKLL